LFKNVDSREYIYNLFESKNEGKSKNLRSVEQVNKYIFGAPLRYAPTPLCFLALIT